MHMASIMASLRILGEFLFHHLFTLPAPNDRLLYERSVKVRKKVEKVFWVAAEAAASFMGSQFTTLKFLLLLQKM